MEGVPLTVENLLVLRPWFGSEVRPTQTMDHEKLTGFATIGLSESNEEGRAMDATGGRCWADMRLRLCLSVLCSFDLTLVKLDDDHNPGKQRQKIYTWTEIDR